ncbi:hypothetical protein PAHAL_7G135500 [Panicum hallii]|uniref:Uncharacterized protein n=1 Tax=Panicum hallii TaxID=206008 RepID=A0A2T8IC75_9POAL|nr:uncharacterized protein LOC112898923 [Panicum hallii]PVH35252.1 hypothetical protein PAHAL_7G135500 [Panicum hallii]
MVWGRGRGGILGSGPVLPAGRRARYKARGCPAGLPQFAALGASPARRLPLLRFLPVGVQFLCSGAGKRGGRGLMASNYVDTAAEEGRFHGHGHHSTTPTGAAAASPKHMRRSWSSASSAHGHAHGAAPKCVCAPATHAGSFKCRLHRASSHGHPASPPSPAAAATTSAAPPPAVPPPSSRTVAAQ